MFSLDYLSYLFVILIITGLLIITMDAKAYKKEGKKKEKKFSLFLGWMNIGLGVAIVVANWVYDTWFW
ncbi:CLC_0170 family protein [Bacillus niameyensis]|uniref:CLC_0170 family protein n=1 Tax=Bacillus niameyensis TaxID=1522308 RepID=UPI0007831182|nr:CLC_0170 family protein [Bacillus niameyensis]